VDHVCNIFSAEILAPMSKELRHLKKIDKKLAIVIAQVGPCELVRRGDSKPNKPQTPFHSLAKSICYQQLHGKAAATIWKRVCELPLTEKKRFGPTWVLTADIKKLRSVGLSGAKAVAMKDLAEKTKAKIVPSWSVLETLSDEEIITRLTTVRGIGQWTVEMMLIFSMGRPDVLPVNDYGVKNGFSKSHNKGVFPTAKELAKYGERWMPYRSYASWYLWRATELSW